MSVIETCRFRLGAGVDEADFLAADHRVQTELHPHQAGAVRRTTARGDNGDWLVVQLWRSADEAAAAAAHATEHPVGRAFRDLLDEHSMRVERYETLD